MEQELIRPELTHEAFRVVLIHTMVLVGIGLSVAAGAVAWGWELVQRGRGKWRS